MASIQNDREQREIQGQQQADSVRYLNELNSVSSFPSSISSPGRANSNSGWKPS